MEVWIEWIIRILKIKFYTYRVLLSFVLIFGKIKNANVNNNYDHKKCVLNKIIILLVYVYRIIITILIIKFYIDYNHSFDIHKMKDKNIYTDLSLKFWNLIILIFLFLNLSQN